MECLLAYLLLALAVDLIRELIAGEDGGNVSAIHRRLWSDTHFDCSSRAFFVLPDAERRSCRVAGQFSQPVGSRRGGQRKGPDVSRFKRTIRLAAAALNG